jgi:hypothetical protein
MLNSLNHSSTLPALERSSGCLPARHLRTGCVVPLCGRNCMQKGSQFAKQKLVVLPRFLVAGRWSRRGRGRAGSQYTTQAVGWRGIEGWALSSFGRPYTPLLKSQMHKKQANAGEKARSASPAPRYIEKNTLAKRESEAKSNSTTSNPTRPGVGKNSLDSPGQGGAPHPRQRYPAQNANGRPMPGTTPVNSRTRHCPTPGLPPSHPGGSQ